ncbi:hypothetical protein C8R44DRAFT_866951 [Mycena epipterygia]|nr:hypothetical protein C8R44DRAFT_866951 [Mycena epipterygia]
MNELFPTDVLDLVIVAFVLGEKSKWQHIARDRGIVALVCGRWKEIAYANPLLWRLIAVHRFSSRHYVEFCVERAQHGEIRLLLDTQAHTRVYMSHRIRDCVTVRSKPLDSYMSQLVPLLSPVIVRATRVTVHCTYAMQWRTLARELGQKPMADLNDLRVHVHEPASSIVPTTEILHGCSTLTCLTFVGVVPCAPAAAYNALTVLKLRSITDTVHVDWETVYLALSATTGLLSLELDDVDFKTFPSEYHVITLPYLRHLSFAYANDDNASILALLSTPVLASVSLRLSYDACLSIALTQGLANFTGVEEVVIAVNGCSRSEMDLLLSAFGHAISLDLRMSHHSIMGTLAAALKGERQWPTMDRLQRINFGGVVSSSQARALLAGMVACSSNHDHVVVAADPGWPARVVEWSCDGAGGLKRTAIGA